jgi:hypothetical protein
VTLEPVARELDVVDVSLEGDEFALSRPSSPHAELATSSTQARPPSTGTPPDPARRRVRGEDAHTRGLYPTWLLDAILWSTHEWFALRRARESRVARASFPDLPAVYREWVAFVDFTGIPPASARSADRHAPFARATCWRAGSTASAPAQPVRVTGWRGRALSRRARPPRRRRTPRRRWPRG